MKYYTLPTGNQKLETCRKLIMKEKVQVWLKMSTRGDVKDARKEEQLLVAKQDLATAAASSADAALQAANEALSTMTTAEFGKSVTALIAEVTRVNAISHTGRRLLGSGGTKHLFAKVHASTKTAALHRALFHAKKSQTRATKKASAIKEKAQRKQSTAKLNLEESKKNVRKIKKDLEGIEGLLKKFKRTQFPGGWVCSRVRLAALRQPD